MQRQRDLQVVPKLQRLLKKDGPERPDLEEDRLKNTDIETAFSFVQGTSHICRCAAPSQEVRATTDQEKEEEEEEVGQV